MVSFQRWVESFTIRGLRGYMRKIRLMLCFVVAMDCLLLLWDRDAARNRVVRKRFSWGHRGQNGAKKEERTILYSK